MVSGIFLSPFSVSSFLKNGEKWRAKALNYPTGYPTKIRTAGPFIGQKKQAKINKKKHAVFLTSKKRSAYFDKNSCYTLISTSFFHSLFSPYTTADGFPMALTPALISEVSLWI